MPVIGVQSRRVLVLMALLWTPVAGATQLCVDDAVGSDSADGSYPSDCVETLQAAFDLALPGDEICLMEGRYASATTSVSGERDARIHVKMCEGVVADDDTNCLYKIGSDAGEDDANTDRGVIVAAAGHSYYTLDGLHFCSDSYGSGKALVYQWGDNDYWYLKNLSYNGTPRDGATLWDERFDGRDGTDSAISLFRMEGTGTVIEGLRSSYTNFQHVSFGDEHQFVTMFGSHLTFSGSHTIAVDSYCGEEELRWTGLLLVQNWLSQSYTSDNMQTNAAVAPDNPNDAYQNGLYPCIGGVRVVENVLATGGEGAVDWKGGRRMTMERNVVIGHNGSGRSGALGWENPVCSAPAFAGSSETNVALLGRNNVFMDNSSAVSWREVNGFYGNTIINNERFADGERGACGAAEMGHAWGSTGAYINNALATIGPMTSISPGTHETTHVDHNVYESTAPSWHLEGSDTTHTDFAAYQAELSTSSMTGREEHSVTASLEEILLDDTLGGRDETDPEQRVHLGFSILTDPLADITDADVEAMISRLGVEPVWATGGAHVADVDADATASTFIDVGEDATTLCCAVTGGVELDEYLDMGLEPDVAQRLVDLRLGDLIEFNGTTTSGVRARIVGMSSNDDDPTFEVIELDTPVTVSSGDTIDVVCAGGEDCSHGLDSTRIGAHNYWDGVVELGATSTDTGTPPDTVDEPLDPEPDDTGLVTGGITATVASSDDDCEEDLATGVVTCTSAFLDLARNLGSVPLDQQVAVRFERVEVPAGAQVRSAVITWVARGSSATDVTLTIDAEASDDAPPMDATAGSLSSRTYTPVTAEWVPEPWTEGDQYATSDLAAVVQAIVDRPGWGGDDAMLFRVSGPLGATANRVAVPWDHDPAAAPVLSVEYEVLPEREEPGRDPSTPGCDHVRAPASGLLLLPALLLAARRRR